MTQQTKCANCGETTTEKDIRPLYELPNLHERLDPGSEVPAGECRECGAFVYLIPTSPKKKWDGQSQIIRDIFGTKWVSL